MATRIAGVDCAVQPNRVGIALASLEGAACRILEARVCSARQQPAEALHAWHKAAQLSLIALDSPLGWPRALAPALSGHFAGEAIEPDANQLFRRLTDDEIYRRLGKQPLDVGANFIARTARASLGMLNELRSLSGATIPLAWSMSVPGITSAIEVYPAATIRASGLPIADYKKPSQREGRMAIIEALPKWLDVSAVKGLLVDSADALDAVLCVLAAVEFCNGNAVPPPDEIKARKEGWIWAGPNPNRSLSAGC